MPIDLKVNGNPVTLDVPSDMPLLWAIRDMLDLKGTKFGCGIGRCGACTVHVDGTPRRSCRTQVSDVVGREVMTIEGLSADGSHPLQQVWKEMDVPQCGYCQAGQLMTAAGLLARNRDPSDEEIDAAMNGNLCRCGTYLRIHAGVRAAARRMAADGAQPGGTGSAGAAGEGR